MEDVLGRRIFAGLIDVGVALVVALLIGGIFGNDPAPGASDSARLGPLDRLLIIAVVLAYYGITEAVWQQTIGKRVMRIRVERVDGSKPSSGPILVRTILRLIDGLLLYLVGLIVILASGQRRQRLGDMAAKTRVVALDAPPPEEEKPPPPEDEDVLAQIMR